MLRDYFGDLLAAIVNPSPEALAAQEGFFERHPVLALAALTSPAWLVPLAAAAGWL